MQVLWAPWRMTYIGDTQRRGCIFCHAATTTDARQHYVLVQQPAVVMRNRFPYANAHLMVAPRTHVGDLSLLSAEEFRTVMDMLRRTVAVLGDAFHPDGMNIG